MFKQFIIALTAGIFAVQAVQARPKVITYEKYGAKGDGVHDDQEAIIKAHSAANEYGVSVVAGRGKTYYIGGGAGVAVIQTDVDFRNARFIIDDTKCEDRGKPVFRVMPSQEPRKIRGVKSISAGQERLDAKVGRRSLVEVTDSTVKVYIRYGGNQNNGVDKKEIFIAGADGTIEYSPVWDYEHVTSIVAYPIDEKPLVIKGGVFTTIANRETSQYNYYQRGIIIERSNVRVEGLTHLVTGEQDSGAPYGGFLSIRKAADVVISGCTLTAHKTYKTVSSRSGKVVSMGSYDITANSCIGLRVEHCTQTTDIDDKAYWGLFASNFCKDIRMEDCVFSRFDAHMGVKDITLRGCTFGHMGVQAVGFGRMLVEDCEVHRQFMVLLRSDYGSFWDGEVEIRHCRLIVPQGNNRAILVGGSNGGTHDFGYECMLPTRVVVDGLYIDDTAAVGSKGYKGPCVFSGFDRNASKPDLIPMRVSGTAELHDITVSSGLPVSISPNKLLFKDYQIKTLF